MTQLNQSYETIASQTPQWVYNQLEIEKEKLKEDKKPTMTRKEFLTRNSKAFRKFDRLKELENGS